MCQLLRSISTKPGQRSVGLKLAWRLVSAALSVLIFATAFCAPILAGHQLKLEEGYTYGDTGANPHLLPHGHLPSHNQDGLQVLVVQSLLDLLRSGFYVHLSEKAFRRLVHKRDVKLTSEVVGFRAGKPTPYDLDYYLKDYQDPPHDLLLALRRVFHAIWAQNKLARGWLYGPVWSLIERRHPALRAFETLLGPEETSASPYLLRNLKLAIQFYKALLGTLPVWRAH